MLGIAASFCMAACFQSTPRSRDTFERAITVFVNVKLIRQFVIDGICGKVHQGSEPISSVRSGRRGCRVIRAGGDSSRAKEESVEIAEAEEMMVQSRSHDLHFLAMDVSLS